MNVTRRASAQIATIELEPQDIATILGEACDLAPRLPSLPEAALLDVLHARAQRARGRLPRLAAALEGLADHRGPRVLMVETAGLVNYTEPTPTRHLLRGDRNLFEPDLLRAFVLGMAGLYGYGFTTQQQGLIHNNIIPIKEFEEVVGHNASSAIDLALHTEVAAYNLGDGLDISPDYVTLHFYRNQPVVPTVVAIPDWDALSPATLELLRQPWFCNRTSPAQGGRRNNAGRPISILYGPQEDPWIRLATSELELDRYGPAQQAALREFVDHMNERTFEIVAGEGTIIADRQPACHARALGACAGPSTALRRDGPLAAAHHGQQQRDPNLALRGRAACGGRAALHRRSDTARTGNRLKCVCEACRKAQGQFVEEERNMDAPEPGTSAMGFDEQLRPEPVPTLLFMLYPEPSAFNAS